MSFKLKNISSSGKGLFIIAVIVILGYPIFLRVRSKFRDRDGSDEQDQVSQTQAATMLPDINREPTDPMPVRLRAGQWSERVNVMLYKVHVLPLTAKLEYECEDSNGKITIRPGQTEPGIHYWKDAVVYQKVRSVDQDIVYSIERK